MKLIDMLSTPEKYIPFGMYCFDGDYYCPFHILQQEDYPQNEYGYCHFLHMSDWDINEQSVGKSLWTRDKDNRYVLDENTIPDSSSICSRTGLKEHNFPTSLLWDDCKECNINMEDPEDIKLVIYSYNLKDDK